MSVEIVRIELSDPLGGTGTLDGFRLRLGPAGVTVACKLTVPVKLLTLVTVTVDVPEEPAVTVRLLGLVVRVKSGVVLAACTASPIISQYKVVSSTYVTVRFVCGELAVWYSTANPAPFKNICVNPGPGVRVP